MGVLREGGREGEREGETAAPLYEWRGVIGGKVWPDATDGLYSVMYTTVTVPSPCQRVSYFVYICKHIGYAKLGVDNAVGSCIRARTFIIIWAIDKPVHMCAS